MLIPKIIRAGAERAKLSPRETDVVALIAQGATWKGAAATLGISIHTLETHMIRIRGKLGASSTPHVLFLIVS